MSPLILQEYASIGGNRQTAASSWSRRSGLLAFGADQNVAVCEPLSHQYTGIHQLLHGHQEKVTAVTFLSDLGEQKAEFIVSGSADGNLLIWAQASSTWTRLCQAAAHQGAVNCIASLPQSNIFVTGGADAKIRVWNFAQNDIVEVLTIVPKPRFIPLTLALGSFHDIDTHNAGFLAAGGTRNDVQVYALKDLAHTAVAEHQATLTGHEGWIRSLCLKETNDHGFLLASASHDKYVRLWRFEHGSPDSLRTQTDPTQITSFHQTLTAKIQKVSLGENRYSITFEALLLGHEDWVYSASWNPVSNPEQLLTASADGTLTIWEPDPTSGIWVSASKLGEISGQKGATTATGSSGGFWTGIWSPDGQAITCLGRTGSWRLWQYDQSQQYWSPKFGIGGHVGSCNGLTWSSLGEYLLSTSSDQTTRLHAEWKSNGKRTWHEFARPQIHGYDLNCIISTGKNQFVSGADEKLLRVFNEPRGIAKMLKNLCEIEEPDGHDLSEGAAIPVLGLSNKAMVDDDETSANINGNQEQDYIMPDLASSIASSEEPPTEDLLARHTLWPEHEKLYGHGYEISESAYSDHYQILATACKATSIDHAVVRLYNTKDWNEIRPPLTAHSLTVTKLAWAYFPDNYLLSVGRDRQWTLFKRDDAIGSWKVMQSNPKAHTRMILDAAWSPVGGIPFFATAGRDKTVKLWCPKRTLPDNNNNDPDFEECATLKRHSAVTALSFTCDPQECYAVLAVGEESGSLSFHNFSLGQRPALVRSVDADQDISTAKPVTKLAWRPNSRYNQTSDRRTHLAVAAADGSVKVLAVDIEELVQSAVA